MMKITVEDERVRKNIEHFKKIVQRQFRYKQKLASAQTRTYLAFVNRVKGDINFLDMLPSEESLKKKNWKPISIRVRISDQEKDQICIEVISEIENDSNFEIGDLDPVACQIISKTIETLNKIAHYLKTQADIETFLEELSSIQLEYFDVDKITTDIIHDAWHQVDRIGAEKLLENQESGTFLFRKDIYASFLEKELSKACGLGIKCITLSYLEEESKVCDKTIVKKGGEWFFYNDDPNLSGPSFSTSNALLSSAKEKLKYPLWH